MFRIVKKYKLLVIISLFMFIATVTIFIKPIEMHIFNIVKHFERNRMVNAVNEYHVFETNRYIIRYENEEDKEIAELTSRILDKHYDKVCSMFNYYPEDKVNIIIYDDSDFLIKNTKLQKGKPPLGVYYSGIISILSPEIWIDDRENLAEIYEENGPVVHEFTHLIVDDITKGNYPMWLTEGIALYTEYETTGFEWGKNLKNADKLTIEDLNNNFEELNPNLSYRRSFEIVYNLSEDRGFDKIRLLLDTLGEGNSMYKSTKTVFKMNLYDLNLPFKRVNSSNCPLF